MKNPRVGSHARNRRTGSNVKGLLGIARVKNINNQLGYYVQYNICCLHDTDFTPVLSIRFLKILTIFTISTNSV